MRCMRRWVIGFISALRRCGRCCVMVSLGAAASTLSPAASAAELLPIGTTGHDQDIFFEAGLAAGATGATGELGSRQFFEAGVFADGVPRILPAFTSPVTGNSINFEFNPFEQNNIIKLDTGNAGPKTLTLAAPAKYGQLAVVFSGGSMATGTEFAVLPYTINYAGGATQTGELQVPDWGATPATLTPDTLDLFNADRTNSDLRIAPATTDNNTTANRWSISVQEVATTQPTTNIDSITFGQPMLNANGTVQALNSGDDVVIYGLAGSGEPLLKGDTDGDGVAGEFPDDFEPIRANFRNTVSTRSMGDLVRNGTVDFDDFREWKTAHLAAGGSLAGLDLSFGSVPEPSAAALVLVAILGVCNFRNRK